ncbi:MAG TPA: OmpA family protein [Burkholderiales bacterium]|jgi:outer membrane protein OmpA-like peptidoglycan-associated protein
MKYVALILSVVLAGCAEGGPGFGQNNRPFNSTETGILAGAAGGAVLGAIAYNKDRSRGAVIGAIGGGIAGGAVGAYMDKQKQDLDKALAHEIQAGQARIDKMPNEVLRITMTNATAFDTNSSTIKPGFDSTMDKVADVVLRYGKTTLTVVGHTDDVGSDQYNQKLSEQRAHAVAEYLETKRVNSMRLALAGKGETQPIASNANESGRQQNRRVEIYVEPVVQG